ncbi:MAG: hypothetical protein M0Z82_08770 [Actinomycetota bacterium]|jgi:hypothetical protein|nr:hypothetical protein [Actinomycetota bacterium]
MSFSVVRATAVFLAVGAVLRMALARQVRSGRIPLGSADQWPPVPHHKR